MIAVINICVSKLVHLCTVSKAVSRAINCVIYQLLVSESIRLILNGEMRQEMYNTLLDSNEGDLSPHTSQTIYFSKTNENKISDKEAPIG